MAQSQINSIRTRTTPHDRFFTPLDIVHRAIQMADITPEMRVLDPSAGEGAFFDNLPPCQKHWCEIERGIDFFNESNRYDLIIGNPPFSIWDRWLDHTIKLTDKFCFVSGILNLTPSRIKRLNNAGFGMTKLHFMKIDYWFAYSVIFVFERNAPSIVSVEPNTIFCETCGKRCKRGQKGGNPNRCSTKSI